MTKDNWMKLSQCKTIENIEDFSKKYNKNTLNFDSPKHEITFLYNIGLFYSEHYESKDIFHTIFRNEDKYYLAIYYYLNIN